MPSRSRRCIRRWPTGAASSKSAWRAESSWRDRADTDELALTHEFMSVMLGVRRSGVTIALHLLVKAGLILAKRGIITVVNRDGLEEMSAGSYGVPEAEFRRVFG
ncbi:MAG TPA: helix-turn-helix domain-containing protein [Dehalococcoidia bacterium]|nr:helix-turn-helix domain-containing protein [Dehalococcoidia bacterium]